MISPDSGNEECFYDAESLVYNDSDMDVGGEEDGDDPRSVYFELEDGDEEGQSADATESGNTETTMSREDKYKTALTDPKGKTIKKAKVNVLQQAKIFENDAKLMFPTAGKVKDNSPSHTDSPKKNTQLTNSGKDDDGADDNDDGMVYETTSSLRPAEKKLPVEQTNTNSEYALASDINTSRDNTEAEYMLASAVQAYQPESGQSEYMLASAVKPEVAKKPEVVKTEYSLASAVSSSASPRTVRSTNIGPQCGTGSAVPVDFIHPVSVPPEDTESSEYSRLYFKCVASETTDDERKRLQEKGYSTLNLIQPENNTKSSGSEFSDGSDDDNNSFDWGSEFDDTISYQDCEDDLPESESKKCDWYTDLPEKPLPQKPGKLKPYQAFIPKPLRSPSYPDELSEVDLATSAVCLPVNIDPSKHPPPLLPSQPEGLTGDQRKRRCVIDLIINSEKSYVESLERIIKQYEKPTLGAIAHPRAHVRVIFAEVREVISHHKMFSIELSECVRKWDEEEKIGDIFTASFSKTMVVNAYSVYVNNFSAAMEEIKSAQRNKQAFDEFLKKQEKSNPDRLSIFGLMVKPVQRFPQFIMCLQDLIKYMPQNHHDRRALQLAVTELENVTHMLNERKRRSEQRFQALQTIHQLTRQKAKHMLTGWNLDTNTKRSLIRYDMVDEVSGEFGQMKCKNRRLVLMNDLVLCVKVIDKEQGGFSVERLGLRWIAKLRDLDLKDTAITPNMESVIKKEPGKIHIISSQLDKSENDPFHLYADLSEMLHDYTVLGQIAGLASTLKRSYAGHGLREELIHEISRDLQCMIQLKDEQLRLVNSCSIVLVDNSRSEKPHYVLQTQTASIKQDWCVDFLMAKMAQNAKNCPAWDAPHASDDQHFDPLPAIFMKHLSVDVPRNYTKIRCAVSVYLAPEKSPIGVGVQHLWVCTSSPNRGQVSILSIHNSKPSLTESFSACNCEILCVELIPGCGDETIPGRYLFVEDTVWMANAQREILVFPLSSLDGVRRDPLAVIERHTKTVSIHFVDERIFCGHENGTMDIFSRDTEGSWAINTPTTLMLGVSLVQSHFVWEEDLWISCGNKMHVVEIDSMETKISHELQSDPLSSICHVVKSGMGMWVSFRSSAVIRLFHLETMENLQEISIGTFLQRIPIDKLQGLSSMLENVVVTSLASSKGLLWIGTSLGVVLTVTLPRLSDGVPLYRGRPSISLHAHRGPVKFLLPLMYASNTLELNRSSSLRSTLQSRPSRRNIERERLEFLDIDRKEESSIFFVPQPSESSSCASKSNTAKSVTISTMSSFNEDAEKSKTWTSSSFKAHGDNLKEKEKSKSKDKKEKGNKKKLLGKKKSFDDSDIVMRRRKESREETSLARRKSQTLSFRSELANRIVSQSNRLSQSSIDLMEEEPTEVELLYENLLEENIGSAFDRSSKTRHTIDTSHSFRSKEWQRVIPNTLPLQATAKLSVSNPSEVPVASSSSFSSNSKSQKKSPSPSSTSLSSEDSAPLASSKKSATPSISDSFTASSNNISRLASRNSMMRTGTSRKANSCNAVIVLSGGDGYLDLDESRSQTGGDDACVLLWIYKF